MNHIFQYTPGMGENNSVDAGDASAALYQNNEKTMESSANKQKTGLQPGQNADELREAKHGNPDASLDGNAEDATGTDSGNATALDETSV